MLVGNVSTIFTSCDDVNTGLWRREDHIYCQRQEDDAK